MIRNTEDETLRYAGFWRRVAAYFIDILPITLIVGLVFYHYLGFDKVWENYRSRWPGDPEAYRDFLTERNRIRNISIGLYLAYSALMDSTALRGTFGKWVVGIEVVGLDGAPLSYSQATMRNAAKTLSFAPFGLGCLWILWSRDKQAWHDTLAHSLVIQHR